MVSIEQETLNFEGLILGITKRREIRFLERDIGREKRREDGILVR